MRILFLITILLISSGLSDAEVHPLSSLIEKQIKSNNYESALLSCNQLIQEFPDRKEGYFNRGLCLYKTDKYSEAILDFNDCLQVDSELVAARFLKAMSLQKRGDLLEAMNVLEGIMQSDATIYSVSKRIKNYQLAVYLSTRWYYMLAMGLILILLMILVINIFSSRKM
ncbi:MAG: tetratricopeptide repeat protein [Chitinophagales bacterium]